MPSPADKPVVAIARAIPGPFSIPGVTVRVGPDHRLPRGELFEYVRGAAIIVTWVSERVDAELLDAAGSALKGVCNFAVGVDNIDLAECARRGVIVTNTPHAVTEGTADLAWALILACARRLVVADRFARSPRYPELGPLGPDEFLGRDLTGRNLLIVGAGRIGLAVALRSIGWGMRVSYVARGRHWEFEQAPLSARRVELDAGLAEADVVSIHCPLTPQTRGLIDARRIGLMKASAILINTARGPIVDEGALASALNAGRIWGAGLDVFEREPVVHPELINCPTAVLAPHIGSAVERFRIQMTEMIRSNAAAILAGDPPPNRVLLATPRVGDS